MLPIATEDGVFLARYSARGLCELKFPRPGSPSGPEPAQSHLSAGLREWHALASNSVKQILAGKPPTRLPPLDLSNGTEFQRRIWNVMLRIPFGEVLTYGEVARKAGNAAAVRAVGGACGANPIPILVPCHRVVAAGRRIGGFSSGLDWKRLLLQREQSYLPLFDR